MDDRDRSWKWWAGGVIVLLVVLWGQAEFRAWKIRTTLDHIRESSRLAPVSQN